MKFQKAFSIEEIKILRSISVEILKKRYPLLKWVKVTDENRTITINAKSKPELAEDEFTKKEKDFLCNIYIIYYYRIYPIFVDSPSNDVKIIHLQNAEVYTLKDFWQDFIDMDIWYRGRFIEREFIPEKLLYLFDKKMKRRNYKN